MFWYDRVTGIQKAELVKEQLGVVYCATGSFQHLQAALTSAIAFHQLNPAIPITVFTDSALTRNDFFRQHLRRYNVTVLEARVLQGSFMSRELKINMGRLSPYEITLYLDSDILPLQPVPEITTFLKDKDLALVVDSNATLGQSDHTDRAEIEMATSLGIPLTATQYNGGVLLWRVGIETAGFFSAWRKEWSKLQKHDQVALIRAIAITGIEVAEMPIEYNTPPPTRDFQIIPESGETRLMHCWGGQIMTGEFFRKARVKTPSAFTLAEQLVRF